MKKKVLAALMCVTMTATMFAGCGGNDSKDAGSNAAEGQQTEAKEQEPETQAAEEPATEEASAPVAEMAAPEELPAEAFAHITFDGDDEGYKAVAQTDNVGDNDGATFGIEETEASLAYADGAVGKCLYLDGNYGLDLGLQATNTDTYTVSFWMNADRLSTFGPTLQMGYNMGKAADAGNDVTWLNVTQSEWGADSAKIFPIVWSRNEASDAADGTDCWPWMYAFDNEIHGKREWVMVTIVSSGEVQNGATGATTVGAQYYVNGVMVYDSQANYSSNAYFEYTWDASLAPNIMQPGDNEFKAYFGINYWDTVFKGYVDDLYVYDTALTAGQVATLYQMGDPSVTPVAPEGDAAEEETAEAPAITITGTAVGAEDCTTAFWGAHSETWAVAEGESVSKTFVNWHGAEAANWNNFVVVLQNVADAHSADDNADYAEYAVVRSDNYGWKGELNTAANADELGWVLESNWNWDTFADDLQGATVVVTVTNNGTTADVVADVTTASGATYQQKYGNIAVDGDLYFCLTVDNCCLDVQ